MKFYLKQKAGVLIALILIVSVYFSYFLKTGPGLRDYDYEGHKEYITYVFQHERLPEATACFECYHPPLYYLAAAAVAKIGALPKPMPLLQVFSLILFLGFLLFSMKAISEVFPTRKEGAFLFLGLLLCWPSGIIHSLRIGNDVPLYLFYSGAFLFALRGWKYGRNQDWTSAAALSLLALLTKGNGVVITTICFALYTLKVFQDSPNRIPRMARPMLWFGLCALAFMGQRLATHTPTLIGNVNQLTRACLVGNGWKNFLLLGWNSFIDVPFTHSQLDGPGRQYFWNYLFKTALFSEFAPVSKKTIVIALFLKSIFFSLLSFFGYGVYLALKKRWIWRTPLLLAILIPLAAIIFARWREPLAPVADFRYIYPMIVPFILFISYCYENVLGGAKRVLKDSILAFSVLSLLFCVNPAATNSRYIPGIDRSTPLVEIRKTILRDWITLSVPQGPGEIQLDSTQCQYDEPADLSVYKTNSLPPLNCTGVLSRLLGGPVVHSLIARQVFRNPGSSVVQAPGLRCRILEIQIALSNSIIEKPEPYQLGLYFDGEQASFPISDLKSFGSSRLSSTDEEASLYRFFGPIWCPAGSREKATAEPVSFKAFLELDHGQIVRSWEQYEGNHTLK